MTDPGLRADDCADRVSLLKTGHQSEQKELAQLRSGLLGTPREIPSRYFYDATGSALFERICGLDEYYQARTEGALLEAHADRIVETARADELIEIGSGAATKTRSLLRAMERLYGTAVYRPLDVDDDMLARVGEELCMEFPELRVEAIEGDFTHSLAHVPPGERQLFIFLGGTIGNLHPTLEAPGFIRMIASRMSASDHFLLGTDLIKSPDRLEAAYNDSEGITVTFNRNIPEVVNRKAGGDFDPGVYEHRAFYDTQHNWIEMRLVATRDQHVTLRTLDVELSIEAGEEIRTEISAKYDRQRIDDLLGQAGMLVVDWLTDPEELFALTLAKPTRMGAAPRGA